MGWNELVLTWTAKQMLVYLNAGEVLSRTFAVFQAATRMLRRTVACGEHTDDSGV